MTFVIREEAAGDILGGGGVLRLQLELKLVKVPAGELRCYRLVQTVLTGCCPESGSDGDGQLIIN